VSKTKTAKPTKRISATIPLSLLLRIREELKRAGDPRKAPIMQAYTKSAMPYHGVNAPLMRSTCRRLFADLEFSTEKVWRTHVLEIWRGATHREERYAAIELTGHKRAMPFQTPAAMPLYEEIIVTGAWWDLVDGVASHNVGWILRDHPKLMRRMMLDWSKSRDMWKRRTSIICQLGFKKRTDLDLLYRCIEPSLDSEEFFLRKAIGWALRQYAWTDPAEVKRYVRRNEARLSGLSKREALKNL